MATFQQLSTVGDVCDVNEQVRRLIAKELILSFVPDEEQRTWRSLTRMKLQLTRDVLRQYSYNLLDAAIF